MYRSLVCVSNVMEHCRGFEREEQEASRGRVEGPLAVEAHRRPRPHHRRETGRTGGQTGHLGAKNSSLYEVSFCILANELKLKICMNPLLLFLREMMGSIGRELVNVDDGVVLNAAAEDPADLFVPLFHL